MKKIRTPFFEIGTKNYIYGDDVLALAKKADELAEKYDVCYRVHSQNYGDLDWAMNGKLSGTEGFGYRLEGIEIKLIPKGTSGPAPDRYPFHKKYKGTLNVESLNGLSNLDTVSIPEDGKIVIKGISDVTDENQKIVVNFHYQYIQFH